ncbi:MAG: serpin family protein [candidate division WOR-3 bacterium]|nr:serpin family protein [candidate division WOR-3 bacterium]
MKTKYLLMILSISLMIFLGTLPSLANAPNNLISLMTTLGMVPSKVKVVPTEKLVNAYNNFTFALFSELTRQDKDKNIFISPLSITFALSMAYNGASKETKTAMAKTLGIAEMELNEVNFGNQTLMNQLKSADPQINLNIANSLWAKAGIKFKSEFLQRNKKYYQSQITTLNFTDPKASNIINNWVKAKTNGKISKIIDKIDPMYTMLYLINAVYFKGKWTKTFDKNQTQDRPFTLINGEKKNLPMMEQKGNYRYLSTDKFQGIALPYGKGKISMYLFLPGTNSNLKEFLSHLNVKNWNEYLSQFDYQDGTIILPRIKLEYEQTLNTALKNLGMEIAFSAGKADFSEMTQTPLDLYINEVKHKTFVEVNEEGTEAAGATSVEIRVTAIREPKEFIMIVDRPFFCAICDNETGSILFMGAIVDPSK